MWISAVTPFITAWCLQQRDKYFMLLITQYASLSGSYIYIYIYIYRFPDVFLRCPTTRIHCFLSSHWPPFRFLSFMAYLIPSIQFFFSLSRALFCFGVHFNLILGNIPSAVLWTWPNHVSWFCSISFKIVSSSPICFLIVTFLILSFVIIIYKIIN